MTRCSNLVFLVEDREKSYGDPRSENMLIHGDNLIALQALQQDFAGKIKCIYIDPPYNTGSAFDTTMIIWNIAFGFP